MCFMCTQLRKRHSTSMKSVIWNLKENLALREFLIDNNLPWELIKMDTFLDIYLKYQAAEIHMQEHLHTNIFWLTEEIT